MTENEIKLEQCRRDKAAIDILEKELEVKVKAEKEPKWIAAVSDCDNRLILNLQGFSSSGRQELIEKLRDVTAQWISFSDDGSYQNSRLISNVEHGHGLKYYCNTKIVFGKDK